jgi:transposase
MISILTPYKIGIIFFLYQSLTRHIYFFSLSVPAPLNKKKTKMSRDSRLSAQRTVVSELWTNNTLKPAEIIRITGFPKTTVYDIVNRLKKRSTVTPLPIPGRPQILSSSQKRHLGRIVQTNNAATAAEMTERLVQKNPNTKVSVRTIQRVLKKNLQFIVCRPLRIPLLRPSHIIARLEWAQNHVHDSWTHTIFSDETTFQMFRNTQLVRHRRGSPRPHRSLVKHPYKVHAWGAFSAQGSISLFLFTENLNARKYCQILETHLFPHISRTRRRLRFQQDNAPVHTAGVTQDFFETHGIQILDWPSNSPDLNPIENLWAILKGKVEKRVNVWLMKKKTLSTSEFQSIIYQEWEGLDSDIFLRLATSMENRLLEVIKCEGKKIDY